MVSGASQRLTVRQLNIEYGRRRVRHTRGNNWPPTVPSRNQRAGLDLLDRHLTVHGLDAGASHKAGVVTELKRLVLPALSGFRIPAVRTELRSQPSARFVNHQLASGQQ